MKIEHFYYDEQEKWLAQMKAAMEKHDAKLSEEERTLEQKRAIWSCKTSSRMLREKKNRHIES